MKHLAEILKKVGALVFEGGGIYTGRNSQKIRCPTTWTLECPCILTFLECWALQMMRWKQVMLVEEVMLVEDKSD